jgi:hypothetical protein
MDWNAGRLKVAQYDDTVSDVASVHAGTQGRLQTGICIVINTSQRPMSHHRYVKLEVDVIRGWI